jgi:hypothetical protein
MFDISRSVSTVWQLCTYGGVAAKNTDRGFRRRAVRSRSQSRIPRTGIWTKRNRVTGRFTAGKTTGGRFKGVRHEK